MRSAMRFQAGVCVYRYAYPRIEDAEMRHGRKNRNQSRLQPRVIKS